MPEEVNASSAGTRCQGCCGGQDTRSVVSSSNLTISGQRSQVSPLPKAGLFLSLTSFWMEEGLAVAHGSASLLGVIKSRHMILVSLNTNLIDDSFY